MLKRMPRARRSVTFWRGRPGPKSNPKFLRPLDRWSYTSLEGWPAGYRNELRREVLRHRRQNPNLSVEGLLRHAARWAARRSRPAAVPKTLERKHVVDLLAPAPKRTTPTGRPDRDRTPRKTELAPEQLPCD